MKKALAILAALALVASAASAQVTIGGWGRGLFAISNTGATGAKTTAVTKKSWDSANGGAPRVGVTLAGSADKVGFVLTVMSDVTINDAPLTTNDNCNIWVKPIDQIKLTLGRAQVDTLRGSAGFGSQNWDRVYGSGDMDDFVFSRISTGLGMQRTYNNKEGLVVEITPMEGLYIAAAFRDVLNSGVDTDWSGTVDTYYDSNLIENMFQNGQYAIGYTIAGVGTIRAQYIGLYQANLLVGDKNQSTIEAAFKLTAVENLYADIGFDMNLAANTAKNIKLYGNYKVAAATIHLIGALTLPSSGDMSMYGGLGLDYALDGGIGINADVRFTKPAAGDSTITFLLGATEGLGNGVVGIAFQGQSKGSVFGYSVPVKFEYWF